MNFLSITDNEIGKLKENLPYLRSVAGLSQEKLGKMIGVTRQSIINFENGRQRFKKFHFIAIVSVLEYEASKNDDLKIALSIVFGSNESSEKIEVTDDEASTWLSEVVGWE